MRQWRRLINTRPSLPCFLLCFALVFIRLLFLFSHMVLEPTSQLSVLSISLLHYRDSCVVLGRFFRDTHQHPPVQNTLEDVLFQFFIWFFGIPVPKTSCYRFHCWGSNQCSLSNAIKPSVNDRSLMITAGFLGILPWIPVHHWLTSINILCRLLVLHSNDSFKPNYSR